MVGAGVRGRAYAHLLAGEPGVEVAGFLTASRDTAEAAQARFGGAVYETIDELVQDRSVDAVILACPADLHAAYAQEALGRGLAVLAAAPAVYTPADIRALSRSHAGPEHRFAVSLAHRYDDVWLGVQALIRERKGALGAVSLRAAFARAGEHSDALQAHLIEDLDLVAWLFGAARIETGFALAQPGGGWSHLTALGQTDTARLSLEVTVLPTPGGAARRSILAVWPEAALEVEVRRDGGSLKAVLTTAGPDGGRGQTRRIDPDQALRQELRTFLNAVRGGDEPFDGASFAAARRAVEALAALKRAVVVDAPAARGARSARR